MVPSWIASKAHQLRSAVSIDETTSPRMLDIADPEVEMNQPGDHIARVVLTSPTNGFVSGHSSIRRVLKIAALTAVAALALASTVYAQRPTPVDIEQMFRPPGRYIPAPFLYKWAEGVPIDFLVVTGNQRGPCVDIKMEALRREVQLMREQVPVLRNIKAPKSTRWVPRIRIEAPLLLGLDMNDSSIRQAMEEYAKFNSPGAQVQQFNRSGHLMAFGDGVALENNRLVLTYRWTLSPGGLSSYSDDTCRQSDWDTEGLKRLLAPGDFLVNASRWGQDRADQGWRRLLNRLFIKALYTCPGSPAAIDCVQANVKALVADPSIMP